MHLKSIKANGFKSFADKTEFLFEKGITAIVGPNGSGKSNVVDAIKWVLGEQSVKNLRGSESMKDVIFYGSASRSGQNRAVVSLTIDNQDHYLNSEFNEIEIKRVIYQTGENEYYLNNVKVRLKDITDLLTDSGAGKESFNIISQGSVTSVVHSKPEERRPIFEEAAGVLKYKKRKEDSLKKLEQTQDNLEKVDLLIKELEVSLAPLKEQSAKAIQYQDYKKELENIEISLITHDITAINEEYQQAKNDLAVLKEQENSFNVQNSEEISQIEKRKLTSLKLDDEINKANEEILSLTNAIANLETQSEVLKERNKYQTAKDTVNQNIIELKERSLSLKSRLELLHSDLDVVKQNLANKEETLQNTQAELDKSQAKHNQLSNECASQTRNIQQLQNSISILTANIENSDRLPYSVRNVLNNPRLKGIHGTIANLIDTEATYMTAIDIALGMNANVVVVDNEKCAEKAIEYLKENRLGRATFFPLNVIESRSIDRQTLDIAKRFKGFIGVADELVKYDSQYTNIIKNQLGNVLVVDSLPSLNELGKLTSHRYRIVSLEGDILHTGGSITGGSIKNNNSILKDKQDLIEYKSALAKAEIQLNKSQNEYLASQNSIDKLKEAIEKNTLEIATLKEQINSKEQELENIEKQFNSTANDLKGNEDILTNQLDKALNQLLEDLYAKNTEKDKKQKHLAALRSQKSDLATEIMELEKSNRENNANYNRWQQQIKDKEIQISKMDVKLDNLLINLNETYSLTYEKANSEYLLDIDIDTARLKVSSLKTQINNLGLVNLGAPEEYNRVNTRYQFLSSQKAELETSIAEIKSIISEMDDIMITRFKETFDAVNQEFAKVFKILFKGGSGYLKLTNEEDLLNTGIEIIAVPPGKKEHSTITLSGGEQSLTAIALLFAILNIKTVPFCILDEVEAALDEANIDTFGKYLQSIKNQSQFIVITHKKKTMEYADTLYGITMQEKGVSKIVSVKLEDN